MSLKNNDDILDTNADETKDIIEEYKQKLIDTINFAIKASDTKDIYTIGLRNGMRYTRSLIDGKDPEYEKCTEGMIPIDSPSYSSDKDYSVKD